MRKKPRKESNSRDVARTNTDATALSPLKAPLMSPRQKNSFSVMAQSAEASANDSSQPISASEWSRLDGNTNHFGSPNFNQGLGVQISPSNIYTPSQGQPLTSQDFAGSYSARQHQQPQLQQQHYQQQYHQQQQQEQQSQERYPHPRTQQQQVHDYVQYSVPLLPQPALPPQHAMYTQRYSQGEHTGYENFASQFQPHQNYGQMYASAAQIGPSIPSSNSSGAHANKRQFPDDPPIARAGSSSSAWPAEQPTVPQGQRGQFYNAGARSNAEIGRANKLQWSSSGTSSSSVTPTPSTTSSEATEQQAINQRGNTNSHARGRQEASSSSSGNSTAQQSSLGHDLVNKESNEPEVPKQSSAYKGVSWHKRDRRWTARAWVDRRTVHLGAYASEEVAAAVVDFKLLQRYRQMASTGRPPRLNFASDADRLALLERSLTDARSDLPTLITTLRISGVDADTDRLLLRLDARLKETSSSASSSSSSSSGTRKEQKQAQPATGTTTDTSLTPASSSSTSQPSGSQFLSSASTSSASSSKPFSSPKRK